MKVREGPNANYKKLLLEKLSEDAVQAAAAGQLQLLHDILHGYELRDSLFSWVDKLPFKSVKSKVMPKGLYIYGGVGRGKSMLMDLFFDGVFVKAKKRVHFHEFMQEVHELIHEWRQCNKGAKNGEPIIPVAAQLAQKSALLCFDEFEVRDIADAMIISRLFTAMFDLGVVVVATSNRHPDELYKDGLQRDLFLPFIKLVKTKLDILHLKDGPDYRLDRLKELKAYIEPAGSGADILLKQIYNELTDGNLGSQETVEVKGRKINVPIASGSVACFGFDDLCSLPLGAGDYLSIAKRFRSIIISDIPTMSDDNRDAARRFMVLIDALYENKIHVVLSAAASPYGLYDGGDWGFEFDRTVSRLLEMQSTDYIESARR